VWVNRSRREFHEVQIIGVKKSSKITKHTKARNKWIHIATCYPFFATLLIKQQKNASSFSNKNFQKSQIADQTEEVYFELCTLTFT
jgi:hypothetical protein